VEKKWFVFYTKSRQEKKVNDLLLRSGFEPYLPLQSTVRQWSDRKKKVVTPLFSSYIFVQAADHEIPRILTTPGVAWTIRDNGKPAIVKNEEISLIQRFIATGLFIETRDAASDNFKTGDKVRILDGPLKGITGFLSGDIKDQKFMVEIESIHQVIRVQIPAYFA
jgi:transcriptional antiterminator RfaH